MRAAKVFLALCLIGVSHTKPHNGKRSADSGLDWNVKWKNFPLPGEQGRLSGNLNGDFEYGNVFDSAKGWDFLKGRYNNFKDGLKELVGLHKRKRSADPHGFGEKFAHTWEGIKKDYHVKKARKEEKLIDKLGDKFIKLEEKKEKLFSKLEDKKADIFVKLEDKKAKKWSKLSKKGGSSHHGGGGSGGSHKSAWKSEYKTKKNEKLYNIGHALGYKAGYYPGLKSGGGKNGHHKRSANPAGVQNTWEGIKKDVKETWEAIKNFIGLGAAATRRKRSPEPNGLNKAGYYLGLKSGRGKNGHHKRSANPAGVQNTWEGIKKDAKEMWEAIKNFIGLGAAATRR